MTRTMRVMMMTMMMTMGGIVRVMRMGVTFSVVIRVGSP